MTDRDINHAFEDFETPVSECIIHRMAGIMQEQKGTCCHLLISCAGSEIQRT
jgi:hypothetical protein